MAQALSWVLWTLGLILLAGGAWTALAELLRPVAGWDGPQTLLLLGLGLLVASRVPRVR